MGYLHLPGVQFSLVCGVVTSTKPTNRTAKLILLLLVGCCQVGGEEASGMHGAWWSRVRCVVAVKASRVCAEVRHDGSVFPNLVILYENQVGYSTTVI